MELTYGSLIEQISKDFEADISLSVKLLQDVQQALCGKQTDCELQTIEDLSHQCEADKKYLIIHLEEQSDVATE